jgi:PAS domain S-box-containing protein
MGARVHAFDWSATPLGPIGDWPPYLCAQASLVLAAPFAHVLLWGPELTVVAYNDAYKAFLGSKPEALGRSILDVWAEVREALAPQFERVLAGETVFMRDARFTLLRGSGPEEAWFDYGFSPVYDEAGRVAGMLHCGVETTARVQAEARLRESEARWRGLFENMHEGFAHCEIVYGPDGRAEDYRHLEVNDAALRLTGLSRQELLGRRAGEAMPGLERMWTDAFARVVETGEPAHIEHRAAPLGRWFEVIAYRTEPGRFGALFLDSHGAQGGGGAAGAAVEGGGPPREERAGGGAGGPAADQRTGPAELCACDRGARGGAGAGADAARRRSLGRSRPAHAAAGRAGRLRRG